MVKLENRRARFDYEFLDKFEAGLVLTGGEVKSIKSGRAQLEGSYVVVRDDPKTGAVEGWLINASIPVYEHSRNEEADPKRSRKLLMHRRELNYLAQKTKEERLTLVPLAVYTTGRLVKLQLALAKGRKTWQKRDLLRKRDLDRDTQRELTGD